MKYHHTVFTVYSLDTKLHWNTLAYEERNVCADRRHTCAHITHKHTHREPPKYLFQPVLSGYDRNNHMKPVHKSWHICFLNPKQTGKVQVTYYASRHSLQSKKQ